MVAFIFIYRFKWHVQKNKHDMDKLLSGDRGRKEKIVLIDASLHPVFFIKMAFIHLPAD